MEKTMTANNYTKVLMTVFTIALLMNGLNPWLNPPEVGAKESSVTSGDNDDTHCISASKNSIKSLEAVNNLERLLGYIESSVSEVKLTVKGIDRKINETSAFDSAGRR